MTKKYLTIVMYHRVGLIKDSDYPLIKGLEFDEFKIQLNYLEKNYKIIAMESLINFIKNDIQLPDNPCLLTFDDGYKDHYLKVFPELKKRNLQGSFFTPAEAVLNKKVLDVDKIHFILAKEPNTNLIIEEIKKLFGEYKNKIKNNSLHNFNVYWKKHAIADRFDTKEVIFVKRILQHGLPENIRIKISDFLFERYVGKNQEEFSSKLYMSKEDLKMMINSKMYIGSHGYHHLWLNTLPKNTQLDEIEKSINFLNSIGASTTNWVMNYPYGSYNSDTLDILKTKNCCIGLTTRNGLANLNTKKFLELSRLDTNDFPKF